MAPIKSPYILRVIITQLSLLFYTIYAEQSDSALIFNESFESEIDTVKNISINGAKIVGENNSKAAFFDGVDDFISFDLPHLNSDNDFSISLWVAPTRYKLASSWVTKSNLNKSKSQFRFGFGWPAKQKLNFTFYDNFWQDEAIDHSIPLHTWTHLVYTLSPKNKKGQLYVNGLLKHEYKLEKYMPSTDPLYLGLQWDDYIFYNGYIDEVNIYNKVISEEDVKKSHNLFIESEKIDTAPQTPSSKNEYTYSIPQKAEDYIATGDIRQTGCDYQSIFSLIKNHFTNDKGDLESILIYKKDKLILEEYFHGNTVDTLHHASSISKSVTSTLLGISIDKGFIRSEEDPLISYYSNEDQHIPCLNDLTLKHVLNHKSGILPIEVPHNLRTSEKWVETVLLNQTECNIGFFKYNELNPEIIIHTIFLYSDLQGLEFADQYLFKPLGIDNYHWLKDQTGTIDGGTGLVMRSRDMLKFGIMYKDKGIFSGNRILSEEWVEKATGEKVTDFKYNYFWSRFHKKIQGTEIYGYSANGFGGQSITIIPELDLVVVTTNSPSGNGLNSNKLIRDMIIPAFLRIEG